jgi:hypothetical protein
MQAAECLTGTRLSMVGQLKAERAQPLIMLLHRVFLYGFSYACRLLTFYPAWA